jgi:hypothetical protein
MSHICSLNSICIIEKCFYAKMHIIGSDISDDYANLVEM